MSALLLDDPLLHALYDRHVRKPAAYLDRHRRLPLHLDDRRWRWAGKDVNRVLGLIEFDEWTGKHGFGRGGKLLATAIDDPEVERLDYRRVVHAPYEQGSNDLHRLALAERDFDMVVFNQTLEHLYNPWLALSRLREHLRPGGFLFTSAPTLNIPHMTPIHFYGFTPMGLVAALTGSGFEVLEVGFWGCAQYLRYIFERHEWPDYRALLGPDGLLPRNEERNVAQAWILARRPLQPSIG